MELKDILKIPTSIIVLDEIHRIIDVNECFSVDLLEFDTIPGDIIGKNIKEFIKNFSECFYRTVAEIVLNGRQLDCIATYKEFNGVKTIFIERPPRSIEKRIKKKFATELSKKIKNPLIIVVKMLNLLSRTDMTSEQHDYIKIMKENSFDILKTNNDLIEYLNLITGNTGRVSSIKMNFNEITEEIKEIVKSRIEKKYITLQFSESNQVLYTDYQKLIQVIVNMIYSSINRTDNGFISVKIMEEDIQIKIYVKDTGNRISPLEIKLLDYVDENSDLMTNLELPIAKELANLLGGNVAIEHTDLSGSLVSFTIPM
jgi:signal transduction histidine kinase